MWNAIANGVSTLYLNGGTGTNPPPNVPVSGQVALGIIPGTIPLARAVLMNPSGSGTGSTNIVLTLPPITTQFPVAPGQPATNPGCGDEFQITLRNVQTSGAGTVTFQASPAVPGYPGDTVNPPDLNPIPNGTSSTSSGLTLMANAATRTWYRIA